MKLRIRLLLLAACLLLADAAAFHQTTSAADAGSRDNDAITAARFSLTIDGAVSFEGVSYQSADSLRAKIDELARQQRPTQIVVEYDPGIDPERLDSLLDDLRTAGLRYELVPVSGR